MASPVLVSVHALACSVRCSALRPKTQCGASAIEEHCIGLCSALHPPTQCTPFFIAPYSPQRMECASPTCPTQQGPPPTLGRRALPFSEISSTLPLACATHTLKPHEASRLRRAGRRHLRQVQPASQGSPAVLQRRAGQEGSLRHRPAQGGSPGLREAHWRHKRQQAVCCG